jgi:hypothetical protein
MLELVRAAMSTQEDTMTTATKRVGTWLAVAAVGAAVVLAPVANAETVHVPVGGAAIPAGPVGGAGTDPLVPYGPDPTVPYTLGFIDPNHDNGNTTNGEVDLPF